MLKFQTAMPRVSRHSQSHFSISCNCFRDEDTIHYQTPGAFQALLEKQVLHYGFKFWNLQGLQNRVN